LRHYELEMKAQLQPNVPQRPALFSDWTAVLDVLVLDAIALGVMIWIPAMVAICMTVIVIVTIGLPIFFLMRRS